METPQEKHSENAIETDDKPIKRDLRGYFLEGTAPGPGRPKGSKSIKDAVRKYLEDNPDAFEDFLDHFITKNRELAWQMLEGRPPQDITSGGEKIIPTPIYGGQSIQISEHDSDQKDISIKEENPSS